MRLHLALTSLLAVLLTTALAACGGDAGPRCGNGVVEAPEECDDGNTASRDGCGFNCKIEPPRCGNGRVEDGEQCDDRNTDDGDGCSATCQNETATVCGNGTVESGEQCDDGNTTSGDGCSSACMTETATPRCGDAHVDSGEQCDDGNTTSGDGCSASCQNEGTTPRCGDGRRDTGEQCDDGNTTNGDGCSSTCQTEVPAPRCGDGRRDTGEQCDDGNTTNGDGCSSTCQTEVPAPRCGDGRRDTGESCDDGNAVGGDGCSTTCAIEPGWACATPGLPCTLVCGDGVRLGAEACDDGNALSGDGCTASCTTELGWSCPPAGGTCAASCGDGVRVGAEGCDDANLTSGDGCSATCALEPGWACVTAGAACSPLCGDGVRLGAEGCDDANLTSGDGCSATCTVELGWTCATAGLPCNATCGDGVRVGGEACDDANLTSGDGCNAACTTEPGWTCATAGAACTATCGDGVRVGAEACDDANLTAGDGCSPSCTLEAGHLFEVEPNDGLFTANGPITGGTIVHGSIGAAGDQDYFAITVAATSDLQLQTWDADPARTTCNSVDTVIHLYDAAGTELASDDDGSTVGLCSLLAPTAYPAVAHLAPGTYYVRVQRFADTGAIPGYQLVVTFLSVCGDGAATSTEVCDDGNLAAGDGCSASCAVEAGHTFESEDNGTIAAADALSPFNGTAVVHGAISPVADADYYAVTLASATDLQLQTWDGDPARATCTSVDTVITLFDAAGTELARDDDGAGVGLCSRLSGATDARLRRLAGTYYVRVERFANSAVIPAYQLVVSLLSVCGDGQVTSTEQCDDGNTTNDATCSPACTAPACGDGYVGNTAGETCDDGNLTSGDGCDANCRPTGCGNGVITTGEACDDGNLTAQDGCSPTCTIEILCGNGTLNTGEQCDDGNTVDGDGCSYSTTPRCQVEAGHFFEVEPNDDGSPSASSDFAVGTVNGPFAASVIIHGAIGVSGDDDVFAVTNPFATPKLVRFDTYNADAGYGYGVACGTVIDTHLFVLDAAGTTLASNDDRNISTDRCSGLEYTIPASTTVYVRVIRFTDTGVIAGYLLSVSIPVCGNGLIELGEACDDANNTNGDGCNAACQFEFVALSETEANDTAATANVLGTIVATRTYEISGAIAVAGDNDWFTFTAPTAMSVMVATYGTAGQVSSCATGEDTIVWLYNGVPTDLTTTSPSVEPTIAAYDDDTNTGLCSLIGGTEAAPARIAIPAGTYYVRVKRFGTTGTIPAYYLRVDLAP